MNGKDIVSRFLEAEANQDVQGMADVLADNIVFEMPFALPGLPDRVEGKNTVVEFLERFLGKERGIFAKAMLVQTGAQGFHALTLSRRDRLSSGRNARSVYGRLRAVHLPRGYFSKPILRRRLSV